MEDEESCGPMEDDVPYLEALLTEGNTTMAIKAYVSKVCNADEFKLCFIHLDEGKDEEDGCNVVDGFNFLYPPLKDDEGGGGSLLLRERLSDMVSRISCCKEEDDANHMTVPSAWRKTYRKNSAKNTTILRTWGETLHFIMHYTFRQMLCDSASLGIRRAAHFFVVFYIMPPSTMHSNAGPGSNLLSRHEPEDKDECSRGSCAVCLEEFEGGDDDLTRLPCSHVFHYRCLAEWWLPKGHRTCCPLCRYKMNWFIIPFALGARLRPLRTDGF